MKKRKLLLLPLFMLVLAACGGGTSSQPSVSTDTSTTEPPVTSVAPSEDDSEDLPSVSISEEPFEETTIAAIRALPKAENGDAIAADKVALRQISGTVTYKFRGATGPSWNITIQEGDDALMLYAISEADYAADFADVAIGDVLTVKGHVATYRHLVELGDIEYVSHTTGTPIVPEVLTSISAASLSGKDSKLVKIEDLKLDRKPNLSAGTSTTVDLLLRKGDHTISTYMHYGIPTEDAQATVDLLETATSNSTLAWTGVLGMNGGVIQLTNAHVSEWEVEVGEPVVLNGISFAETEKEIAPDGFFTPKLVVDPFDGPLTGLVYASSNEAVATVDQTGKVTALAAGTTDITATVGAIEAKVVVTVLGVALDKQAEFDFENFDSDSWGYSVTSITQGSQTWATKEGRVDFDANDSASATAENGAKVLRLRGKNVAYLESPEFTSVGTVTFDAKYYSSSNTDAVMTVSYQLNGESTWTLAQTISLTASYVKQEVVIDKENVKVRIDATIKTSNIDNLVVLAKPAVEEPVGPVEGSVEHFLAQDNGFIGPLTAIITNLGPRNSFSMEDATGAVAFRKAGFNAETPLPFAVGDKVTGTFKKAVYKGLVQAELVKDTPTVETGPFTSGLAKVDLNEVGLTTAALLPFQSRLVEGELTVVSFDKDSYGTYTLTVSDGTNSIVIRIDNRVPGYAGFVHLEALVENDVVVIDGATLTWFNGPQIMADNGAQIVKKVTLVNPWE